MTVSTESDQSSRLALGRVPPNDLEAEQTVLGSLLLTATAFLLVGDPRPRRFYRPAHGLNFAPCRELADRNEPVDPITVSAFLQQQGDLRRARGGAYLHTLVECVPTAANAGHYAAIVEECALRRDGVQASLRTLEAILRAQGLAVETVEAGVEDLRLVRDRRPGGVDQAPVSRGEFLGQSDDEPRWMRWPEFGVALASAAGRAAETVGLVDFRPWRGGRTRPGSAGRWPAQLVRGDQWPWPGAERAESRQWS